MSYELMRSSFALELSNQNMPIEEIQKVLTSLDVVANDYEIAKKSMDLITVGEIPEVVKIYIASMAVENKSKGTIRGYYQILRRFFEAVKKPFNAIDTNDIRVFLYNYQRDHGIKKSTLEHMRVVINAFYSWLVSEEILEKNPARKIQPIEVQRKTRHAMTPLELEYLRTCCEDPRDKAVVDFLFATGCRVSECANVLLTDINWDSRSVLIRHGKGDKERTVFFNPECEVSLKAYLSSRKGQSEYLFCRSRAPFDGMSGKALEDIIHSVCKRASEHLHTHITPHVFRHTMATVALKNGMPIEQVQQLLGHASLDTTMIYADVDKEAVRYGYQKHLN